MRSSPTFFAVAITAMVSSAAHTALATADLDLAFVLDTTGSMSSEIQEAKERVRQLAESIAAARPTARIRLGVVAYRDLGDAYVTRVSPLSPDVDKSFLFLSDLEANGGGDGPEHVLAGVRAALDELGWDLAHDVERQLFLIGDAPPHLDYADGPRVDDVLRDALRDQIVINAIGCRSLPAEGVEFFRTLAYATEGVYHHIGRVQVGGDWKPGSDGGGLADAVLATLSDDRGEPLSVAFRDRLDLAGVRALAVEARIEDGLTCGLTVAVPDGMRLDREPQVDVGNQGLRIRLALADGQGEHLSYALGRCVPAATPIHVELED